MQLMSLPPPSGLESGPATSPSATPATAAPGANAAEIGAFVAALLTQTTAAEASTGAATPAPVVVDEGSATGATGGAPLPAEGQAFAAALPAFALLSPAAPAPPAVAGAAAPLTLLAQRPTAPAPAVAGARALRPTQLPIGGPDGLAQTPPLSTDRPALDAALSALVKRPEIIAPAGEPQNADAPDPPDGRSAIQAAARGLETGSAGAAYAGKATVLPAQQPDVFSERLHQHIAVMVSSNAQHARIAVNPADLGPVEVRVSVIGDEATIHLAAPTAATRELLEDALPRLRAAFADSGIALGNAGVFEQMPERGSSSAQALADHTPDGGAAVVDDVGAPALRVVRLGLVDAFV